MAERLNNPFKISELVETVNNLVDTTIDDSNLVHKTGNETIGGNKTFSGVGTFTNYNAFWKTPYNIIVRSTSIENGVTPSSNQYMGIEFRDKNDVRVGWIGLAKKTDGTQQIELQKQGSTSGFTAPTPPTGDNSNQIATTGWVNSTGNNVVHKTGDETITGSKTFTSNQYIKNVDCSIANPPASTSWKYIDYIDSNNVRIGVIGSQINTNGTRGVYLQAGNEGGISVFTNGTTVYTSTVTPPASDNSTKIATTAWVRSNGVIAASFYSSNGYVKFNHGLMINWGIIGTGSNSQTITFSRAYSTIPNLFAGNNYNSTGSFPGFANQSTTGCTVYHNSGIAGWWLAVGY